jgi:hypothetical protein
MSFFTQKATVSPKRIKDLVADLQAAKDNWRKSQAGLRAVGKMVVDARQAIVDGQTQLQEAEKAFNADPGGARGILDEARDNLKKVHENMRDLQPVYEAKVKDFQYDSITHQTDMRNAKNALVDGIVTRETENLDAGTILQLTRGFAALNLTGNVTNWAYYLSSVIPDPDPSELAAIQSKIVKEFPVLVDAS